MNAINDGNIVIATDLDNADLEKKLAKMKKKIMEQEKAINSMKADRSPLAEQAKQAAAELDRAKAKLYEMQSASSGAFSSEQIERQKENVKHLQSQWNDTQKKVESYDRKIENATAALNRNKEEAGEVAAQLAQTGPAAKAMADATAAANARLAKFSRRVKGLLKRVLVFSLITVALRSMREWMGKVIKTNEDATAAVARLKGALLTLAQPLVEVIIPAFTLFVNILTSLVSKTAELVAMLFGSTAEQAAKAAESLNAEVDALEGTGKAAKKASKSLAAFDEINKLSNNDSSSEEIAPDFSGVLTSDWLKEALGETAGKVATGLMLGGIALVAIGAALGNLGVVVAGLLLLGAGVSVVEDTGVLLAWAETLGLDTVEGYVTAALLLGGIALVALGAALGNILMIVAGLGILGAGIAVGLESGTLASWVETLGLESVFDYVVVAMQLAGIALIAIGACMGNLALVIAGCLLMGFGTAAEAIGEETLDDWWETLKLTNVQQWVGAAMLLTGIALIAIGACMSNILMIIAGAAIVGLGSITASEGNLKDWVTVLGLEKVAGWVTTVLLLVGIGLVVFGICSGNIAMLLAGAGLLGAGVAVGATTGTFSDWLDSITGAFSSFVDKFLGLWNRLWSGIDGFIQKISDGVGGIISPIVDWINTKSSGFSFSTSLGGVSVPHLATGAVIPPNREFLAVLGDQKSGTNIEAPLDTIVAAFKQALNESGGGGGGSTTVILELDGVQFGKAAFKAYNKESRRVGVNLAEV